MQYVSDQKFNQKIKIGLVGATGSVGSSVLDICGRFPEIFRVVMLAANKNEKKLIELGRKFGAEVLILAGVNGSFKEPGFKCMTGIKALEEFALADCADQIVFASSGTAAIRSLQNALNNNLNVSLANKESIVVAGSWVMPSVKRADQLRPIDSEHSAIWQCIRDCDKEEVDRIWITASGGPFRKVSLDALSKIKPSDALKHPIWKMGSKITVDSATLMNKGIECIEAMRLFGLSASKVGAVIHPKAQIHGIVGFIDGTIKMLASEASMKLPSAAAMAWPHRLPLLNRGFEPLSPNVFALNFEPIDENRFPCFKTAIEAGKEGGAYPALLIGADEIAVEAFLEERIKFTDINCVVSDTLSAWNGSQPNSIDEAIALVGDGKRIAEKICRSRSNRC